MEIKPSEVFLSDEDLVLLTGYRWKSKQVAQLRQMGLPFFVNAAGAPRVAKATVEGRKETVPKEKTWEPKWAKGL